MSAEIIPFPRPERPRLELVPLPPVSTQVRQLDPAAWGFPSREAMERAWAEEDGPDAA